ncbi:hypothetical protein CPB84DRAFT_1688902 [Gymnopilus junonius]|uniref:Uncharacterized protein n=1 Tax=Gymnopilus junonius TaxID=109634 RepID=A0A9P5TG77_GYMJU|nr:hypothetical protein CPB84DRAFT_1688902 [Gymnopilus junonius]
MPCLLYYDSYLKCSLIAYSCMKRIGITPPLVKITDKHLKTGTPSISLRGV